MQHLVMIVTVIAVVGMISGSASAQDASNGLPQALQRHDTDIKTLLADNQTAIAAAIAALDAKVATNTALQRHQKSIKELLDANTALIEALSNSIAKGTDIVRVAAAVAANKAALDALTTALRNHHTGVKALVGTLEALVTANKGLLDALSTDSAHIKQVVDYVKGVVDANNALLEVIANSPGAIDPKIVFVSSSTFKPGLNLSLDQANTACQDEAESASLPGTYKAWLSIKGAEQTTTPSRSFKKSLGPYMRPDGMIVAESYSDLTDGLIESPINLSANGVQVVDNTAVWTGTWADGTGTGDSCGTNWEYSGGCPFTPCDRGEVGRVGHINSSWTAAGWDYCNSTAVHHIYCFQQ